MSTTSMRWSDEAPYQNIENNPRVADDEVIWCDCGDEAVLVSNDGKVGLCWFCYDRWYETHEAPANG